MYDKANYILHYLSNLFYWLIKILLCSLGIRQKIFSVHKVRWLVKLLLKLTKVCLIKMLNRLEEIKPPCICVRLVFSDASIFKWDSIQNGSKKFMNSFLQFALLVVYNIQLQASSRQRYTYRVLQTNQMELILLCVWAEPAVLGSTKIALKFKYEILIG